MEWSNYILLGFIGGGIFFACAAWALHWAVKDGQFNNLDAASTTIFDDEEPEGIMTDAFPDMKRKQKEPPRQ